MNKDGPARLSVVSCMSPTGLVQFPAINLRPIILRNDPSVHNLEAKNRIFLSDKLTVYFFFRGPHITWMNFPGSSLRPISLCK
jgi:hypothetical protein